MEETQYDVENKVCCLDRQLYDLSVVFPTTATTTTPVADKVSCCDIKPFNVETQMCCALNIVNKPTAKLATTTGIDALPKCCRSKPFIPVNH